MSFLPIPPPLSGRPSFCAGRNRGIAARMFPSRNARLDSDQPLGMMHFMQFAAVIRQADTARIRLREAAFTEIQRNACPATIPADILTAADGTRNVSINAISPLSCIKQFARFFPLSR